MPEIDRDRLAKLLGMIGSVHDGEALNAARMAHALVKSAGSTWEEVLDKAPTFILPPRPPAPIFWRRSKAGNEWATLDGLYTVIIPQRGSYSVGYRYGKDDTIEWSGGFQTSTAAKIWAECFLREQL